MRRLSVICVAAIAVPALVQSSYAQGLGNLAGASRASNRINQTLNRTSNGPGFGGANRFGGYAPPPGGFSNGNVMDLQGPQGPAFGGQNAQRARSGLSQFSSGTSMYDQPGDSGMLMLLGRSSSANWFTNPTYSGLGGMSPGRAPTYSDPRLTEMVHASWQLAMKNGLHHRIFDKLEGGSVPDGMTRMSLANPLPLPENLYASSEKGPSPAQRLADELDASHKRYLASGWRYLAEGGAPPSQQRVADNEQKLAYLRCRNAFESARMIKGDDVEAAAGKLLCAIADGERASAVVYLDMLFEMHPNLLDLNYRLDEVLGSRRTADMVLADISASVGPSPQNAKIAALEIWLLWLDGQRATARSRAEQLREKFRDSPYAVLVEKILVAEKEASQKSVPAT
jgi:hypothetical protein